MVSHWRNGAGRSLYRRHGQAYAWADLVVCRSGALTVSELAIMGRPAILVPLPHAIDDHQTANARSLTSVALPCCCARLIWMKLVSLACCKDIWLTRSVLRNGGCSRAAATPGSGPACQ